MVIFISLPSQKSSIMQSPENQKKKTGCCAALTCIYIYKIIHLFIAFTVMMLCTAIASNDSGKRQNSAGILSFTLHATDHVSICCGAMIMRIAFEINSC